MPSHPPSAKLEGLGEATFFIRNLGCKVNRVESDMIGSQLIRCGANPAPLGVAAVVIVNTCTVTAEADHKARKAVRRALSQPQAPIVVVTGCGTAVCPNAYRTLGRRVVVEPDRMRVPGIVCKLLRLDGRVPSASEGFARAGEGFPTRAGIKVQDGCDNACTYCIVPAARGPAKSRDAASVVAEVVAASEAGIAEVVLTGINLGRYGSELTGRKVDLAELLKLLMERTGIARVRLSSVEPPDVSPRLLAAMAHGGDRVARHLHIPLQSGCNQTLAQMGRRYTADEYAQTVALARRELPGIAVTTDVIAGFPGETDGDFDESIAFCELMAFSKMHVFRYSKREGTLAAKRADQVPAQVSAKRATALRELSARLCRADAEARVGFSETVLFESDGRGTSSSYHRVICRDTRPKSGELLRVRFSGLTEDSLLIGEPESAP